MTFTQAEIEDIIARIEQNAEIAMPQFDDSKHDQRLKQAVLGDYLTRHGHSPLPANLLGDRSEANRAWGRTEGWKKYASMFKSNIAGAENEGRGEVYAFRATPAGILAVKTGIATSTLSDAQMYRLNHDLEAITFIAEDTRRRQRGLRQLNVFGAAAGLAAIAGGVYGLRADTAAALAHGSEVLSRGIEIAGFTLTDAFVTGMYLLGRRELRPREAMPHQFSQDIQSRAFGYEITQFRNLAENLARWQQGYP